VAGGGVIEVGPGLFTNPADKEESHSPDGLGPAYTGAFPAAVETKMPLLLPPPPLYAAIYISPMALRSAFTALFAQSPFPSGIPPKMSSMSCGSMSRALFIVLPVASWAQAPAQAIDQIQPWVA
jgi:hypothetical protein